MRKSDYDRQYMKNNCKVYRLQLNKENDKDIIDYLSAQSNINGTIKRAIRKEMKRMSLRVLTNVIDPNEEAIIVLNSRNESAGIEGLDTSYLDFPILSKWKTDNIVYATISDDNFMLLQNYNMINSMSITEMEMNYGTGFLEYILNEKEDKKKELGYLKGFAFKKAYSEWLDQEYGYYQDNEMIKVYATSEAIEHGIDEIVRKLKRNYQVWDGDIYGNYDPDIREMEIWMPDETDEASETPCSGASLTFVRFEEED